MSAAGGGIQENKAWLIVFSALKWNQRRFSLGTCAPASPVSHRRAPQDTSVLQLLVPGTGGMGTGLAPVSPWAQRGLCSRTRGWKEEELGEPCSASRGAEKKAGGAARQAGAVGPQPSALCSWGILPETFQGSPAAQLHPGLGEGGESPEKGPLMGSHVD